MSSTYSTRDAISDELHVAMSRIAGMTDADFQSEDDFKRTQLLHSLCRALELHPSWDACQGMADRIRDLEGAVKVMERALRMADKDCEARAKRIAELEAALRVAMKGCGSAIHVANNSHLITSGEGFGSLSADDLLRAMEKDARRGYDAGEAALAAGDDNA